jgi:predicted enzyme related to lactoylglutathione lyase
MSVRLQWMMIDCTDPEQLAAFWGALLSRKVRKRRDPYVFLATGRSGGYHLGFQRVGESKTGKNRVHPDLICDDVHVTAAQVEALGGTRVPSADPGGFLVMADPEGNEFCLLPRGPIHMDADGTAHYLDR